MIEKWRDVVGLEGRYQASDFGRVRSLDRTTIRSDGQTRRYRGKMLTPTLLPVGYFAVRLMVDGKYLTHYVHRLVLLSFVGSPLEDEECRHLDGDPQNNHLGNLKWGTSGENSADMIRHGTIVRGESIWCAKLTELDVLAIRVWARCGYMMKDIAAVFDVHPSNITMIVKRKRWSWV